MSCGRGGGGQCVCVCGGEGRGGGLTGIVGWVGVGVGDGEREGGGCQEEGWWGVHVITPPPVREMGCITVHQSLPLGIPHRVCNPCPALPLPCPCPAPAMQGTSTCVSSGFLSCAIDRPRDVTVPDWWESSTVASGGGPQRHVAHPHKAAEGGRKAHRQH